MADDEDEKREELMKINKEYKIWKAETPFFYDMIISHALEWPSITVDWLPGKYKRPDKDHSVQKFVLGTHTTEGNPNYLMLADMLPLEDYFENDPPHHHYINSDFGGFGSPRGRTNRVQIIQQIKHDGEVNRARHMPQNTFNIATKTASGEVHIFDYSKHPSRPPRDAACDPDLRLTGQSTEGFGLSWNQFKQGYLLSGSADSQLCLWDINGTSKNKALESMQSFKAFGPVEDVAWHRRNQHLFGSVDDDKYLLIWDIRTPSSSKPAQFVVAHQGEVSSLSFNPFNEWLLATGSMDTTAKLFDLRKISTAVHTLVSHKESVLQVGWSPKCEPILASSCSGRRVMLWDLSRIGQPQVPKDAEGPPELLFIHGGHTNSVSEFSWNPNEDWVIASVAKDNIIQIWEPAEHIYNYDSAEPQDEYSKERGGLIAKIPEVISPGQVPEFQNIYYVNGKRGIELYLLGPSWVTLSQYLLLFGFLKCEGNQKPRYLS